MGRRSGSRADEGYRIETLNRLAFPKGQNPICELTGLPATIQCVTPHVTLYYATREHAEQAWHGIMRRISPLVGPLRNPAPIIGSKEERERKALVVEMSKKALVDLCQQEASKFLTQGNYELAVPGAIQAIALAFAQDAYGAQSLEMVPAYLLLSQANLGLARLQSAEEFLSLANWVVLRNPDCSSAVRSQLHQNFGKLYRAQGKLDKALQELSSHVYCSSVEVGPEHISTSAGYFLMADVFYTQRKVNTALAFYDKVVDIWYKLLASMCHGSADEVPEEQLAEVPTYPLALALASDALLSETSLQSCILDPSSGPDATVTQQLAEVDASMLLLLVRCWPLTCVHMSCRPQLTCC
ncbi:hypothetical protein JKP88DRAFT_160308 [Tribonema minus]|uniref:Zinc finger MYND domain-containing protein 12 n=1 Tax=Tribonema minus TaxID=303371 RepID=A0A836CPP5_9STRA|nr:hypothetical protein JKP88DRAFT_160308 [Tribonema minus]